MSAGDPSFYHHRQKEPALRGLLLTMLAVMLFGAGSMVASMKAASDMGCPRWLYGTTRMGSWCVTTPVTGVTWDIRYKALVKIPVRRFLAALPPRRHAQLERAIRFYNAFLASIAIVVLAAFITLYVMSGALAKPERPRLHGTRFWATTEQVLGTGLAVGHRPSWRRRFFARRQHK